MDAGWSRFHLRVRRIYSREGVRSIPKDWCRISPQIFAEDADRNLSKPQPGGLFGTLRGFAPREARILHAAISTYHAQEMQKHKPRRGFSWITRIKSKHPTTEGTEEHGGTMQPQISQNTQIKELGPALFLSRTRRGFSRITRIKKQHPTTEGTEEHEERCSRRFSQNAQIKK